LAFGVLGFGKISFTVIIRCLFILKILRNKFLFNLTKKLL
jgi:hypothetical protein